MNSLSDAELLEMFRAVDSPIDKTLGMEFVEVNGTEGTCTLKYQIGKEFTGPLGAVFGGIQAAMLDAALSIAGTAKSAHTMGMVSLEIKTSYLRSAKPGVFLAKGRTIRLGKKAAFLESELFDAEDRLIARATGTAVPVSFNH